MNATRPVESFLQDLSSTGVEVIYSSVLVPPILTADVDPAITDRLAAARAALATNGLELWELAPRRFVVRRSSVAVVAPGQVAAPNEPLQEVSVYASRFAIDGSSINESMAMSGPEIDAVPGAHDDAMRALKALPGLASNVSARPYIRGSLSEDVLVRYDGINLLDPYHFKNFQSLFSAIDPAAVEGIEVFSGGFPVQYGTRSGGVINVTAPTISTGYENRVAASAISAGVSTIGRADDLPLEWFGALRRSTLDLIEPVENGLGKPEFSDTIGRLRWHTDNGVWTAGWLLLDDHLKLGAPDDDEFADARYRDEYVWLARDHHFNDALSMRLNAVLTTAERERQGTVSDEGIVDGSVSDSQEFKRFELSNSWTFDASPDSSYSFGGELATSDSEYLYSRSLTLSPGISTIFDRPPDDSLQLAIKPEVFTYALYAANRRQWKNLEAELGIRLDGQKFRGMGRHTQGSPRLNLRYDLSKRTRLYASIGRFTQAQHIEEWRVEEGQQRADPAQLSIHSVLGLTFEAPAALRWSIEAYSKRWTRVSPYFDNTLDRLSLLPDLSPDRVRLAPKSSEASGLELNARLSLFDGASAWGSFSWSRVTDDFGPHDVVRSWDQALAASAGFSWQRSGLNLSAFGGWHRGWPRTPYELTAITQTSPGSLELGTRNSRRWGDYFSLDLRGAYAWKFGRGELSTTVEITNATDNANECCTTIEAVGPGDALRVDTDHWLPTIVNLGFVYKWGDR